MSRKIGLSEFTSQRLAELKARRAEAEASDNNQNLFAANSVALTEPTISEAPQKPSPPIPPIKPVLLERPTVPIFQPSTAIIEPFSQTIKSENCATNNTNDESENLGFACLPEQIHRKAIKKGFDFTIMLVGQTGLGKSTMVTSMFFNRDLYNDRDELTQNKTVSIEKRHLEIEEHNVKLRLTIIDTPGFNDTIDCSQCWQPIEEYIVGQFEQYYVDESGLNRRNIRDHRVHCCLYFLSPSNRGLQQIDIQMMLRLHNKVNIVPVIAKADTLKPCELSALKMKIREDIEKYRVKVYELPECESDEEEEVKARDDDIRKLMPFAVASSNTHVEVGGRKVKGRVYPWGVVEVENPKHSDFARLRQFLVSTHMQDLKDVTREMHYENYRAGRIKQDFCSDGGCSVEGAELLRQKEEEIRRMQEVLIRMQSQLKSSNTAV